MIVGSSGNLSGETLDFFAFDADGDVWSVVGAAWVVWDDASFVDYRVEAVEVGTTGRYVADLPDGTASWELRKQDATLDGSYVLAAGDAVAAGGGSSITADEVVAALLNETLEGDLKLGQLLRGMVSVLMGKTVVSGDVGETRTLTFKNVSGSVTRLTITVSPTNSRTNVLVGDLD